MVAVVGVVERNEEELRIRLVRIADHLSMDEILLEYRESDLVAVDAS